MKVELVNIRQLPWVNRNIVYTITDLWTDIKYNIVGEHNNQRHSDYVCASRADTERKLRTSNGNFNDWTARPVVLTIGERHFAGATHNAAHAPNMPQCRPSTEIGHSGHFCFWVLGATTGGSESYRLDMLRQVENAYALATEQKPTVSTVKIDLNGIVTEVPAENVNGSWIATLQSENKIALRDVLTSIGYPNLTWDGTNSIIVARR